MRWLSPKVLFNLIRQRLGFVGGALGRVGGILDMLRIWRRPKLLLGVVGGLLLLVGAVVVILPSPENALTAGSKAQLMAGAEVKVKQVKKVKSAAQLKAEAAKKKAAADAERKLRLALLAATKRILTTETRKMAAARERKRLAKLNRKLQWIARGNGRFWKVTRLGFEGKSRKKKATGETKKKMTPVENLFASNAFPMGADEEDGTYTIGDDPDDPAAADDKKLPGKDWRKHIWTPKGTGPKKSKKKKSKKAKRKPQVTPASFIYATYDSSAKDILKLPPVAERVFRHSRSLVPVVDAFDEDVRKAMAEAWWVQDFVSLTAIIRGNLFGKVERIAVRYRLSSMRLDRMKPWAVAAFFSLEPAEGVRLRAGRPALAEALQIRARQRGLPVAALETADQYVDVHADFTDAEQIELLAQAVRMNRKVEKHRAAMKKAYLAGETAKMLKMYRVWVHSYGPVLSDKMLSRIVKTRSRGMVRNMMAQINRGRAFITVPAVNMPGRNGVLRLLSRNGYRVRYVETDSKKPMLVANPKYVNAPFFGDTLDPTPRKKPRALIAKKKMKPKGGSKAMMKTKAKPMAKPGSKKTRKATSEPE